MNKLYYRLWHILIIGFIIAAPIAYFFFGSFSDTENHENRNLNGMPVLSLETIEAYPVDFESYYNDVFPFRNSFIRANSAISYYLFHESVSPSVIVGKNDWLFYTGSTTIQQYTGKEIYSEQQLRQISDNLTSAQQYLKERNCEFVLFVAPNKERLYHENMPDYFGGLQKCNTEQIIEYLRSNTDINVVWAYEALESYKSRHPDELLYYKSDTHWNDLGAYIGARALLHGVGVEIPPAEMVDKTQRSYSGSDLANLINLQKDLSAKSVSYVIQGYPAQGMQILEDDVFTEYRYRNSDKDERKFMMIRDSFSNSMRYVLGAEFNESCMIPSASFQKESFDAEQPDILVFETVERDIYQLLDFCITE